MLMAPVSLIFFSVPVSSCACAWPAQSTAAITVPNRWERFIYPVLDGFDSESRHAQPLGQARQRYRLALAQTGPEAEAAAGRGLSRPRPSPSRAGMSNAIPVPVMR